MRNDTAMARKIRQQLPDVMRCDGEGCNFRTPSVFMMEEHEESCENLLLFGVAHGDFIPWIDGQVFE